MVLYKGEQRIDQLPEMLHEFGQAKISLCSFIFFFLFIFSAPRHRLSICLCLHMIDFCITLTVY